MAVATYFIIKLCAERFVLQLYHTSLRQNRVYDKLCCGLNLLRLNYICDISAEKKMGKHEWQII